MIEVFDCEQGTPEWHACRRGIPTASRFADVMTKGEGKTRRKYLYELLGERLTGECAESFSSAHMERGKVMEAEARDLYLFRHDVEHRQVGFILNPELRAGCSPDSLVGEDGGLEIKTALPHIQIERVLGEKLPAEHRAQVQGLLWITGRKWWDFMSYWPRITPLIVRVEPDTEYIAKIAAEVAAFNAELDELQKRFA